MANAVRPDLEEQFDVGNLPRGGDGFTITATSGPADNQVAGGSFKIVVDTENWDNSVGLNSPGQSGDIHDPHYRDLYQLWARGEYFPDLLLSLQSGLRGGEKVYARTPSSRRFREVGQSLQATNFHLNSKFDLFQQDETAPITISWRGCYPS